MRTARIRLLASLAAAHLIAQDLAARLDDAVKTVAADQELNTTSEVFAPQLSHGAAFLLAAGS